MAPHGAEREGNQLWCLIAVQCIQKRTSGPGTPCTWPLISITCHVSLNKTAYVKHYGVVKCLTVSGFRVCPLPWKKKVLVLAWVMRKSRSCHSRMLLVSTRSDILTFHHIGYFIRKYDPHRNVPRVRATTQQYIWVCLLAPYVRRHGRPSVCKPETVLRLSHGTRYKIEPPCRCCAYHSPHQMSFTKCHFNYFKFALCQSIKRRIFFQFTILWGRPREFMSLKSWQFLCFI